MVSPNRSEADYAFIDGNVRSICMSLPQAREKPFGGHSAPSFRIGEKLFASLYEDRSALIAKGAPGVQESLVQSDPDRYFVPAYVGHKGWVGVRLNRETDWTEVAELVEDSFRLIAPKRVSAQMPESHQAGQDRPGAS